MALSLELLQNAALIMAIAFGHWFIVARWPAGRLLARLASGLLFGLASVAAMSMAVEFAPGVIFDSRSVILAVGALFGGPVVAALSAAIAAGYRLFLGGEGALVGVCVILTCTGLGLAAHLRYRHSLRNMRPVVLLLLGALVHLAAVSWFILLPLDFQSEVIDQLAAPYVGVLSLVTVALGMLLREIERSTHFHDIIRDRQAHLALIFDSTAVAMLEEDVTRVFQRLEEFRRDGVTDLERYLATRPDLVDRMIDEVKVVQANPAAVRLFGAAGAKDLRGGIGRHFGPGARDVFIRELNAIWSGMERFRHEVVFIGADRTEIPCVIAFPVPRDEIQAGRVPVSILDISEEKRSEAIIADERRRLREVVWGTNVGTWEWNVVTGETVFNERWAEIVGYSLEELGPVSIETWRKLAHPDDLKISEAALKKAWSGERDFYEAEIRMRHRSGRWVWVLDRGNVVERDAAGNPVRMSGTHMDVTVRKEAEIRARQVADLLETLLRCHDEILRAKDEGELFQRTTETLVRARHYSLAWIGIPESGGVKPVRQVSSAGAETSYLRDLEVHWSEDELGQGPTGRAVRTGEVQVVHELETEPGYEPWSASARRHDFRSCVAAPIKVAGEVVAVLNIYSTTTNAFVEDELTLIADFADSFGLALGSIRLSREAARLSGELEEAAFSAVHAIAATIEKRDPYTAGHQDAVARLSVAIGRKLGWDAFKLQGLRLGATIHDIGKIHIPSEILNRPGRLSELEFALIKDHPRVGSEILEGTRFPWPIQAMIRQHHERLDGKGYPDGLPGDQIIDEAKVLAVADVVDAITSHRPYRPGKGVDAALAEIEDGRGTRYDPQVVDACATLIGPEGFDWQAAPGPR